MGGGPRFVEGVETVKKKCLARPSKKICPKCMLLGTSGVIWCDLWTFWSDFRDFRMQKNNVLLNACQNRKGLLASVVSNRLQIVLS